jgi:hypothetical protein
MQICIRRGLMVAKGICNTLLYIIIAIVYACFDLKILEAEVYSLYILEHAF